MNDDPRLIEIETKIAYQEDLLQALNQTVIKLQQQVDRLELRNQQLRDNLRQMQAQLPSEQNSHEVPPHY